MICILFLLDNAAYFAMIFHFHRFVSQYRIRLNLSNHYLYIKGWRGFKILHFEGVHAYEIHYVPHRQLEWCRYPWTINYLLKDIFGWASFFNEICNIFSFFDTHCNENPIYVFLFWVCEGFIFSQDRSTYFLQQNRQIDRGTEVGIDTCK